MSSSNAGAKRRFVAKNGDRLEDMSSWDPEEQVFILDRSRRELSKRPAGSTTRHHTTATVTRIRRRRK